ncbi:hypothetical protein L6452_44753 [Arctium lappa]|nr:hypothetical protein L6452_44752 [Arctium lappa]KAI3664268.1 hypothetical protein L6452_44753 [Arctium lappa]
MMAIDLGFPFTSLVDEATAGLREDMHGPKTSEDIAVHEGTIRTDMVEAKHVPHEETARISMFQRLSATKTIDDRLKFDATEGANQKKDFASIGGGSSTRMAWRNPDSHQSTHGGFGGKVVSYQQKTGEGFTFIDIQPLQIPAEGGSEEVSDNVSVSGSGKEASKVVMDETGSQTTVSND